MATFFIFWRWQTECFQCEIWHRFCFKISDSWSVYGNHSEIQSNNQAALILQSSCMQPFHLPSTDVVLTWQWLLPYAKFGSESWKLRWLLCKLYVKHYVWISFGFSHTKFNADVWTLSITWRQPWKTVILHLTAIFCGTWTMETAIKYTAYSDKTAIQLMHNMI
jgi:hypothetical protein